jgi:hypothetical protein
MYTLVIMPSLWSSEIKVYPDSLITIVSARRCLQRLCDIAGYPEPDAVRVGRVRQLLQFDFEGEAPALRHAAAGGARPHKQVHEGKLKKNCMFYFNSNYTLMSSLIGLKRLT